MARWIDHPDGSCIFNFESFVMRSILLGLFGHQSNIGNIAHGGYIESTVFLAKINGCLVDACVVAVRDDRFGIFRVPVGSPHLTGCADHGGHGSINDYITGNMQVGDSLVGVDHGQGWACSDDLCKACIYSCLLLRIQGIDYPVEIREPIIGIETCLL